MCWPNLRRLTNWDQGQMPLAAVVQIIDAVGTRSALVGADICDEFSAANDANWFKRWEARIDQPRREASADSRARHEATNRELLMTIKKAARR
jgi:hypothetical protein